MVLNLKNFLLGDPPILSRGQLDTLYDRHENQYYAIFQKLEYNFWEVTIFYVLPWKQEVPRSKMHVLNLTNIYDVCNSHNCQTVTLNKRKCNATISLPISIHYIIRGPNGGLILIILGAQGGKN